MYTVYIKHIYVCIYVYIERKRLINRSTTWKARIWAEGNKKTSESLWSRSQYLEKGKVVTEHAWKRKKLRIYKDIREKKIFVWEIKDNMYGEWFWNIHTYTSFTAKGFTLFSLMWSSYPFRPSHFFIHFPFQKRNCSKYFYKLRNQIIFNFNINIKEDIKINDFEHQLFFLFLTTLIFVFKTWWMSLLQNTSISYISIE